MAAPSRAPGRLASRPHLGASKDRASAAAAHPSAEPAIAALTSTQPTRLRQLLIGFDLLAAVLPWVAAALVRSGGGPGPSMQSRLVAAPLLGLAFVAVANARGLYRAQVCSIRASEIERLGQVVFVAAAATLVAGPGLGLRLPAREVVACALASFVLASAFRSAFRSRLASGRRQGRFQRRVVIVGGGSEARDLLELVAEQPQLGLQVLGVIGEPDDTGQRLFGARHLGPVSRTLDLVRGSGATGVLIAPSALASEELNQLTRTLLDAGVHVHISNGLRGFAAHRVRPQLLAHQSVLYLEPRRQARWQLVAKRALDLGLGAVVLVLSLPVLALAAVAIKLDDGGPVIFRQSRVGRGGKAFTILKLRTMVPDAEARYDELAARLAGREWPLVKLHSDPRVTRVGRVLRAASIDELPQLLNVFGGSMSLVGPRPNLVAEAEGLDPVHLAHKCKVRPGISGLWQVEARDDPSYSVYRRLDVFYLENWSVGLDLAILLATVQRVVGRALRLLVTRPRRSSAGAEATAASPGPPELETARLG